jgi:hypothetical protein
MKKLCAIALLLGAALRADFPLATFERGVNTEAAGKNLEYFSDKDESKASKTQVMGQPQDAGFKGKSLRLRYRVAPNPTLGYQYAGFAIPLEGKSLAEYASLSFYLHSPSGTVPPLVIGLKNKANDRDKVQLSSYVSALPSDRWVKVTVPMADFKVMRSASMLAEMDSVAFSFEEGEGVLDFDEISMSGSRSGIQASLEKPAPRVRPVWRKGHAVWCYHDKDWNIAQIQKYNSGAKDPYRILYVFPWTGSFTFKAGGQSVFDWEPEEALYYAKKLGPGYEIHPIIDASANGFELLSQAEIDDLAARTAAKLDEHPEFAGVQLDIEPHSTLIHAFYAALRRHMRKPISVAVSRWSAETFEYADAVAYMMYDISDNPRQYGATINRKLFEFMRDAASVHGQAFIGMPAVASHSEFSFKKNKATGQVVQSGYQMEDFMDWAFKGVSKYATGDFKDAYVGMGVWGLLGGDSMSSAKDADDYQPSVISDRSWAYFRKPLQLGD